MKSKGKEHKLLFWIITVLSPFIILGLLETILIFSDYKGENQKLFREIDPSQNLVVANTNYLSRYFEGFTPEIAISPFNKTKQEDSYRIFVLGGSSAQGFPYHFYHSFPYSMYHRFNLETVGLQPEIINLGMTAVNSYVIWDLKEEIVKADPDAVIIYAGHNEYYGSFGVGSNQFGHLNSMFLKRLILKLKDFRLYQFLEGILRPSASTTSDRTMMSQVVKESEIIFDQETYKQGIDQFRNNITDFVDVMKANDIKVVIGTIASNIKDQPPFSDNKTAHHNYAVADSLLKAGKIQAASQKFTEAKDFDEIRFRAPSAINEVIKNIADNKEVELVDIEDLSFQASEQGIPGDDLFTDHLHPNSSFHQKIGEQFFEVLKKEPEVAASVIDTLFKYSPDISRFEKTYTDISMLRLRSGYPFKNGLSIPEETALFNSTFKNYSVNHYADSIAKDAWINGAPAPEALTEIVQKSIDRNDSLTMVSHYKELLNWHYLDEEILKMGINYTIDSRNFDFYNIPMLHRILNIERDDPFFINSLAALYIFNQDLNRGEYWIKKTEEIAPENPEILLNYVRLNLAKGDTLTATRYMNRYRLKQMGID
jgi:lysophospholipase L1-like esterase